MIFNLLNNNQRTIASTCILVLGIAQICVDSWILHKLQEHGELILFLSGTTVPSKDMHDMTYAQAASYFSRIKQFLGEDLLTSLELLKMTSILGLVAGILQLFSSTAVVMWAGRSVDFFWLVLNVIVSVLLSVAVAYSASYMIRDVFYHQVLLTVTSVNLFILVHIWIINLVAFVQSTCLRKEESSDNPVETATPQTSSASGRHRETNAQSSQEPRRESHSQSAQETRTRS